MPQYSRAGRSPSALAAGDPDLLGRPLAGPFGGGIRKIRRRILGRPELDEVLDRESALAKNANPVAMAQGEVDGLIARPTRADGGPATGERARWSPAAPRPACTASGAWS